MKTHDSYPPERAIVFDIETVPHPQLGLNLGFDQKLETAKKCSLDDLKRLVSLEGIKLGTRNQEASIRKCVVSHYEKERDRAALKLYGFAICAIGMVDLYGDEVTTWVVDDDHSEAQVLQAFVAELVEVPSILCGFNVRGFDIPRILVRAAAYRTVLPTWFPCDERAAKYDRRYVFDCQDVLSEGKLDYWLRMFGLPLKSATGAAVSGMTPEERRQYVANDVECERQLVNRLAINAPSLFIESALPI